MLTKTFKCSLIVVLGLFMYWWFIYRMPSQRMLRLLDGDKTVAIQKIAITTVPRSETFSLTDAEGVEYFSALVRKAKKEGYVPTRRQKQHYAIVSLGTFHSAKIGLYPDPAGRGLTIYYPYHEDGPTDIEYYWLPLDDPVPVAFLAFYNKLCEEDGVGTITPSK